MHMFLLKVTKFVQVKVLAISEFDKGNLFMFNGKMLQKIKFFLILTLIEIGEIGGNLSMIGSATLNSLGLKEKANLMSREKK